MWIASIQIGFIEVPNSTTLNIYTVGCKHNCNGCHTKNLQDFEYPYKLWLDHRKFYDKINVSKDLVNGIVWLGGDAVFQKDEFLKLSRSIKTIDFKLFNCLYTGFTFEELSVDVRDVCDFIVDGKWDGHPITDTETNQRIFKKSLENNWSQVAYSQFNAN